MLISNHTVSAVSRLYAGSQTTSTRRVDTVRAVQQPDALELSGEAQSFGDILQKLRAGDGVRADRVASLSARTDAGTYAPVPDEIAAKMLAMRY